MRRARTIRVRLTLWYGGLFLLTGFLLLAANFALVSRNFPSDRAELTDAVARQLDVPPEELRPNRLVQVEPSDRFGARRFEFGALFDSVVAEVKADTLRQLIIQSGVALAGMAVVSMGLGWVVAGRMLRPLSEISATVRRISDESLDQRVALEGPADELKELADQFDVMLDRLEAAFQAQREFVANASHELRTPLAIIRTELDVALDAESATSEELREMGTVVRRAIARSERLLDQLLILARADEPVQHAERVDLAAVAERVLAEQSTAIDQRGLSARRELATAELGGDRTLLERLVGNLVENAVQHNEQDGWLTVATDRDGQQVTIRVSNGGPEIGDEDVGRLFDRFARLDRSRSRATGGYGLGLSIVRAIARGHGGEAHASARRGGGLDVTVMLPV
jgi:signal transduction histidine kinase